MNEKMAAAEAIDMLNGWYTRITRLGWVDLDEYLRKEHDIDDEEVCGNTAEEVMIAFVNKYVG